MLYESHRVILKKDDQVEDITLQMQSSDSESVDLDLKDGDVIYIGSYFPFNSFFLDLEIAESEDEYPDSKMLIKYWDGNKFIEAVDILDSTSVSKKSMSKSGNILFSQDFQRSQMCSIHDTRRLGPVDLSGLALFDLFWIAVEFDNDLSEHLSLNKIGYCFTTDEKLRSLRSEVDNFLSSFAERLGKPKTNWTTEIMIASKMVVTDLKRAGLIRSREQVISSDDFWLPASYKALEIIYQQLGRGYEEEVKGFRHGYHKTLSTRNVQLDESMNGRREASQAGSTVSRGTR